MLRWAMILLLAAPLAAQDKFSRKKGDAEVVNFFLPGQFDKVKAEAKKLDRLILIKGVAFGVDKIGATCATKGKW